MSCPDKAEAKTKKRRKVVMSCIKKRRGKWVVDWRDPQGRRHWETKEDKKAAQDRLSEILKGKTP